MILTLANLLSRGYFPGEVPPPFTTTQFAKAVTAPGVSLPIDFRKRKNEWCEFTSSSLARPGSFDDVPQKRALVRIGRNVMLSADISRFYASIYTHVIEWAISSKKLAKRQLKTKFKGESVGAQIDSLIQACQSGQTCGIPIGRERIEAQGK
jgi:hypothetical protein